MIKYYGLCSVNDLVLAFVVALSSSGRNEGLLDEISFPATVSATERHCFIQFYNFYLYCGWRSASNRILLYLIPESLLNEACVSACSTIME